MGQLKNRLILIAMMLALPLAGLVFFGLLTEHNFNTLPYFTEEGEMAGRTLAAQRVGAFELTNQNGEPFSSESLKGKVWIARSLGPTHLMWRKSPSNCFGPTSGTGTKTTFRWCASR